MHSEIQRNAEISLTKQIFKSILDYIRSDLFENDLQLLSDHELTKQLGLSLVMFVKAIRQAMFKMITTYSLRSLLSIGKF